MFDFVKATHHESGIAVYTEDGLSNSLVVANWASSDAAENALPLALFALGTIWRREPEDAELIKVKDVDDVREEFGGSVFEDPEEPGTVDTDLDIVEDPNGDIAAMFGFKTGDANPEWYKEYEMPYSGSVWRVSGRDDVYLITVDMWN